MLTLAAAGLAPAPGQTPATALGLGYPTPPVDGRAAAMGGVGVGLLGPTLSVRNPADITQFRASALSITAAPEGAELTGPNGSASADRSRFSVIRAVLPLGQWRGSLEVGSELDQDWLFQTRDTLSLRSGEFPFTERREQNGGVSTVGVSLARQLGPLSLGLTYQRLTGSLRQSFLRRFEVPVDTTMAAPSPVAEGASWSYSSNRLRTGAGVQIGGSVRFSAAYGWTGDLEAERDTLDIRRITPMPETFSAGGSVRLEDWLVTLGGGWDGWSDARGSLPKATVRDHVWAGGGVEYSFRYASTDLQVRGGARYAELPFGVRGKQPPDESAVTLGLGADLVGGALGLDLALEVGQRGDVARTGSEETFRRVTLTTTVRR